MKEGAHGEGVAQEGGKLKHEIWRMGARLICRRCQRSAKEGAYGKALMRNECEGSAAGRTLVELTGNRIFLWNEYASSRRELARKGGQQVTMGGVPWGAVDEDRLHELVKDERGVENLRAGLGFEAVQVVLERGESREDAARRMDRGEEGRAGPWGADEGGCSHRPTWMRQEATC